MSKNISGHTYIKMEAYDFVQCVYKFTRHTLLQIVDLCLVLALLTLSRFCRLLGLSSSVYHEHLLKTPKAIYLIVYHSTMSFLFGFCSDGSVQPTERNTQKRLLKDNNSEEYDSSLLVSKEEEITKLSRQNESLQKQLSSLEQELEETKQKYSSVEQKSQEYADKIVMDRVYILYIYNIILTIYLYTI